MTCICTECFTSPLQFIRCNRRGLKVVIDSQLLASIGSPNQQLIVVDWFEEHFCYGGGLSFPLLLSELSNSLVLIRKLRTHLSISWLYTMHKIFEN